MASTARRRATVLPDDIPSVKEYLTRNMQEQVALWKEDKLRLQLQNGPGEEASETEKQLAKIIGKISGLRKTCRRWVRL